MDDFLKQQIASMNQVMAAGVKAGREIERQECEAREKVLIVALEFIGNGESDNPAWTALNALAEYRGQAAKEAA